MHSEIIIQHLQVHGQQLDTEVAKAVKLPLRDVQDTLERLALKGELSRASVTRFVDGERFDGVIYRPIGFIPKPTPGRKPGPA